MYVLHGIFMDTFSIIFKADEFSNNTNSIEIDIYFIC